jgi:hypothetical protein
MKKFDKKLIQAGDLAKHEDGDYGLVILNSAGTLQIIYENTAWGEISGEDVEYRRLPKKIDRSYYSPEAWKDSWDRARVIFRKDKISDLNIELSEDRTATLTNNGVVVGCLTIPYETIDELNKNIKKFKKEYLNK